MKQQNVSIKYDDGRFWQLCEDEHGVYEQPVNNFAWLDAMANNAHWSMSVKGSKQRKHHPKSGMTLSICALLDNVKDELAKDYGASVLCLTPDVVVEFFYA